VPHSDDLEDQAKELEVATALPWVFLPFLRFVTRFLSAFIILSQFEAHGSVETDAKFLSRGALDWMRVQGSCEHVVEVGNSSQ